MNNLLVALPPLGSKRNSLVFQQLAHLVKSLFELVNLAGESVSAGLDLPFSAVLSSRSPQGHLNWFGCFKLSRDLERSRSLFPLGAIDSKKIYLLIFV